MEILPPRERNIILTGDPDQRFDPFSYIWCYSNPEIVVQNPLLQQHFQHILQFDDSFDSDFGSELGEAPPTQSDFEEEEESFRTPPESEDKRIPTPIPDEQPPPEQQQPEPQAHEPAR